MKKKDISNLMNKNTLLLTILIFCITNAFACDCIGDESVKSAIKNSNIVIRGLIISRESIIYVDTLKLFEDSTKKEFAVPLFTWKLYKYRVVVTEKYKGKNLTDTITIMTGVGNGDCGFPFETGKEYIIYGISKNPYQKKYLRMEKAETLKGTYWTDICTRTTLYNDKERSAILHKNWNEGKG
jgi:hypothetical protein